MSGQTPDPQADSPTVNIPAAPYNSAAVGRARDVLEAIPEKIGHYRILERIGGGGMGEVFVAEQTAPIKRRVALKIIKAGMDTKQVVARFEAERQALAMMDHPNIARVFDAGTTDTGRPYFVMELVRGVPITQFCDDAKLSTRQRVELLVPVCQAVQHAHQKGIIHRDLKPTNVLVTLHDGVPVPKVIDFGIAKATIQPLTDKTVYTEFRQMIGTPAYMSPEQAEMSSLDIDTRSDIYSLGVLMYELLTGTTPFDTTRLVKAGLGEIQRIIKEEEPPRPSLRVSSLGQTLPSIAAQRSIEPARLGKLIAGEPDWIVMKAMEKDRKRRYATANDLAADLQRHLAGEPINAAPPSAAYRARKFVRKHRGPVIGTGVVSTLLVLGLAGTSWQWRKANYNAAIAVANESRAEMERAEVELQKSKAEQQKDAAETEAYIANLTLAYGALNQGDYEEAHARLSACPDKRRGWEWQHLSKRADVASQFFPGRCTMYEVSRDGQWLIASDMDTVSIWEVATGKLIRKIQIPDHKLHNIAISDNGSIVAYTTANDVVELHDTKNGALIGKPIRPDPWTSGLSFSSDGHRIATAHIEVEVRVWDVATGEPVGKPLSLMDPASRTNILTHRAFTCQLNADGSRLLATHHNGTVIVWDVESGQQIGNPFSHAYDESFCPAPTFNHDGTRVITYKNNQAFLHSLPPLPPMDVTLEPSNPQSFAFSHDGRQVLTTAGASLYRLNVERGSRVLSPLLLKQDVIDAKFIEDDSRIVVRHRDSVDGMRSISVWSEDGTQLGDWSFPDTSENGDDGDDDRTRFRIGGDHFFYLTKFGILCLDAKRLNDGLSLISKYNDVEDVAKIEDDASISEAIWPPPRLRATIADDGGIEVVEISTGLVVKRFPPVGAKPVACDISPNGDRLVAVGPRGVCFYDISTLRLLLTCRTSISPRWVRFSRDGSRLILYFQDGFKGGIQIWDTRPTETRQRDWKRQAVERVAAKAYVDELLASDTPTGKLELLVKSDRSLGPRRRLEVRISLEREIAAIDRQIREATVDSEMQLPRSLALNRLAPDTPRRVRDGVREHRIDHYDIWDVLITGSRDKTFYRAAIEDLQAQLDKPEPDDDNYNALAYAYYRVGEYEAAITTLSRPKAITPPPGKAGAAGRDHIADWAFLALAHYRRGDADEARRLWTTFRNAYEQTDERRKERYSPLWAEAAALIDPVGTQSATQPATTLPATVPAGNDGPGR